MDIHRVIQGEGVRANPRRIHFTNNPLRYLLGHISPRLFGMPHHLAVILYDPITGRVKQRRDVFNTVTTAGKEGIADQILASPSLGKPTHMAIGTGTGGTTTLNSELDRNALSSKTRSGAVVTMTGDWAAGDGTGALTEAGVLTASSGGDLWLYTTFSVVNKGAADALQIPWTLTIA